jgi:heme O synthase-like polyprenyltransferase
VGLATSSLLVLSIRLIARPSQQRALALFHTSNLYLAVVMLMICVNTLMS